MMKLNKMSLKQPNNKNNLCCLILALVLLWISDAAVAQNITADSAINVPLGGNGWLSKGAQARIGDDGLSNWINKHDTISIYIRTEAAGKLKLALKLRIADGSGTIRITAGQAVLTRTIANPDAQVVDFGTVDIKKPGYTRISLQGISKSGKEFAQVSDIVLKGSALNKGSAYVKNNQGNYYYWGHRGPSVHLNYKLPEEANNTVAWFYNEVTVPVGQDVLGSYFMADGFTGGYFGMQVNSPAERHVLFSIWSPYNTNDPKSIPDSLKIKLLKKGNTVHAGEFGSEGSGGQSYLTYPWVAGKTYAFLIHARANPTLGTTVFTAYFKEAGNGDWQLIASFNRPKSGFYLKGLYSFLENFEPEMGNVTRKVFFGNQWVVDTQGNWYPINNALFTGDATANINYRKDYAGGVDKNLFYLRNCGFFDDLTPLKTNLTRPLLPAAHPQINFDALP